jgi:hypothetical protein
MPISFYSSSRIEIPNRKRGLSKKLAISDIVVVPHT